VLPPFHSSPSPTVRLARGSVALARSLRHPSIWPVASAQTRAVDDDDRICSFFTDECTLVFSSVVTARISSIMSGSPLLHFGFTENREKTPCDRNVFFFSGRCRNSALHSSRSAGPIFLVLDVASCQYYARHQRAAVNRSQPVNAPMAALSTATGKWPFRNRAMKNFTIGSVFENLSDEDCRSFGYDSFTEISRLPYLHADKSRRDCALSPAGWLRLFQSVPTADVQPVLTPPSCGLLRVLFLTPARPALRSFSKTAE